MIIYKYRLDPHHTNLILMQKGAKILTVQMKGEHDPFIWAMCDLTQPVVQRRIHIRPTGELFDEPTGAYIGTFQMYGDLVFHVFDSGEVK